MNWIHRLKLGGMTWCLMSGAVVHAATWHVDDDGIDYQDPDFSSIQSAIDAASDGDQIFVYAGVYSLTSGGSGAVIELSGKSLELTAVGVVDVSGQGERRCFQSTMGSQHQTIISGMNFIDGYSGFGGGVYCDQSSPVFINCSITNCTAQTGGGGLYLSDSMAELHNCDIIDNSVIGAGFVEGGGLYTGNGSPTLFGCLIQGNTAEGSIVAKGGGIRVASGDLTLLASRIESNVATADLVTAGGGLSTDFGRTTGVDLVFCENTPDHQNGLVSPASGNVYAFSCQDSDANGLPDEANQVGDGVHLVPSEFATIRQAIQIAGEGDEIVVAPGNYLGTGDSIIDTQGKHVTIRSQGGAEKTLLNGFTSKRIFSATHGESHRLKIEGFTLTQGYHPQFGGGVYCQHSHPYFIDCVLDSNFSGYDGGGIYCDQSKLTLDGCTVQNNTAGENGGAVRCESSSPRFINTVFSGNESVNDGGAIEVDEDSSPLFVSCWFEDNSTNNGFSGGAMRSFGNPILIDTILCENDPNDIEGSWTNAMSNTSWPDCSDCNDDGIPDVDQIGLLLSDHDNDGRPDECEGDCDDDGIPDPIEIFDGTQQDLNGDGLPDDCAAEWVDCDGDGLVDLQACLEQLVADCNENLIPDSCEIKSGEATDCNGNGQIDSCDLVNNPDLDCDGNGILDACEVDLEFDCDQSGVPDVCEIADGTLQDTDGDGLPDICRCIGDVLQDDVVDVADLMYVINNLGEAGGTADTDWNGVVDVIDVLLVIHHWGACEV